MLCLVMSTRTSQRVQGDVRNSLLAWKPVTEAIGGVWGEQESALTFLGFVLQTLVELDASAEALLCTRYDLERHAVCNAVGCPAHGRLRSSTESQKTPMVLVQNPEADVSSLPELLAKQWQLTVLDEGLRCDECDATKTVQEKTVVRDFATVLVFSFPRGSEVQQNRQTRNTRIIDCPVDLIFEEQGKQYSLAAIVEHIGVAENADRGHFVAWVRQESEWLRFDDMHISARDTLPEDARRGVSWLISYALRAG